MWLIVGVSGATCSGKSTVAQSLHKQLPGSFLVCQDDFFLPVDSQQHTLIPALNHINWEIMTSLDMEKMHAVIENCLFSDSAKTVLPITSLVEAVNRVAGSPLHAESDKIGTALNINTGCHRAIPEDMVQFKPDGTQSMATCEIDTDNISSKTKMADGHGDKQILGVRILIIEGFLIFNDKKIADLCHCKYFLTLTREQCWARRSVRPYDPPDVPGYFDQCIWPEYEKHRDEVFKQVPNVIVIDGNQNRTSVLKQVLLGITQRAHELLQLQKS
ncbi:hypothetical protein B7P43_G02355 [Cryptotermes secundus]|uniref:Nicotinamide riboside kinase 1 n=2 Tax=Cryptotermes secundus TaxID=105785 RepID=A0A2J7RB50_9NEOP|nr:hypothetical protein B7P43_G02355 [Cryptotermes secundus]